MNDSPATPQQVTVSDTVGLDTFRMVEGSLNSTIEMLRSRLQLFDATTRSLVVAQSKAKELEEKVKSLEEKGQANAVLIAGFESQLESAKSEIDRLNSVVAAGS